MNISLIVKTFRTSLAVGRFSENSSVNRKVELFGNAVKCHGSMQRFGCRQEALTFSFVKLCNKKFNNSVNTRGNAIWCERAFMIHVILLLMYCFFNSIDKIYFFYLLGSLELKDLKLTKSALVS